VASASEADINEAVSSDDQRATLRLRNSSKKPGCPTFTAPDPTIAGGVKAMTAAALEILK
jgi:hypothetical protein